MGSLGLNLDHFSAWLLLVSFIILRQTFQPSLASQCLLYIWCISYHPPSNSEMLSFNFRGRAPIASMDAMEDMDILTGSNPAIQQDCSLLGKGVITGLRQRHLGKSGLKAGISLSSLPTWHVLFWQVSNIGLGSLKAFSSENCEINEELVTLGNCWNSVLGHWILDGFQK